MRKSIRFFGSKFSRDDANEQFTPYTATNSNTNTNNRLSRMFGQVTSSSTLNSQQNSLNFTLPRMMKVDMNDPWQSLEFIKQCEKGAFGIHAIEFHNVQFLIQKLMDSNSIYSEMPTFSIQKHESANVTVTATVKQSNSLQELNQSTTTDGVPTSLRLLNSPSSTSLTNSPIFGVAQSSPSLRRETIAAVGGGGGSSSMLSPTTHNSSIDDISSTGSNSSLGSTVTNPSIPISSSPSSSPVNRVLNQESINEKSKSNNGGFGRLKKMFKKVSPSTPSSPKKKKPKVVKNLFDSMPNLTKLTFSESFSNEAEVELFEGNPLSQLCEYMTNSSAISLSNLTSLEILSTHRSIGSSGCKYLANGKLKNLTSLNFSQSSGTNGGTVVGNNCFSVVDSHVAGIKPKGCKYLANGNLNHLIQLNLEGNRIHAKGCQYLSNGNLLNVTHLNLMNCAIDFDACQYLGNGNLRNLNYLNLERNFLIGSGVQFIFNGNLPNLTWISLESCEIGSSDCAFIGNSDVSSLVYLNLSNNPIVDEGCKNLANGKFVSLQELDLRNCRIGSNGFLEITGISGNSNRLSKLFVDHNVIGDEGCRNISNLPFLTCLSISNNNLGSKGCRYIALLPQLVKLVISRNNVGSSGCLYLNTLSKLEYLDLIENDIRDAGCEILANCGGSLQNLKSLLVNQNSIGVEGVKFLLGGDFPKLENLQLQDAKDGSMHANSSMTQEVYQQNAVVK